MGEREADLRSSKANVVKPASEGVPGSSGCDRSGQLHTGSGRCSCDSATGVGIKCDIQCVRVPLSEECEVRALTMGVRESNYRTSELGIVEPANEGVSGSGGCNCRSDLPIGSNRCSGDRYSAVGVERYRKCVGIPLGIKGKVARLAVSVREQNNRAG